MKKLSGEPFDKWRETGPTVIELYGTIGDETCGAFRMPSLVFPAFCLHIIASANQGWDHVSVSLPRRCPTWGEMSAVKQAFFLPDEWAFELHPPQSKNINAHPFCLHLWRCWCYDLPLPPAWMVGPAQERKTDGIDQRK